ncbi:MAG: hypothetical protein NUW02_00810 [Candidatus Campbellbacteria bacterium]|nr:hypothetical protein [Candidatus Campbellbacteria bacterium]
MFFLKHTRLLKNISAGMLVGCALFVAWSLISPQPVLAIEQCPPEEYPCDQPVAITSFSASPTSVGSGQTTTLTWNSSHAYICSGSGPGFGPQLPVDGSDASTALTTTTTFTITCENDSYSLSRDVTVTVTGASYTVLGRTSPTSGAQGTISPASRSVSSGGSTTFTVTPNANYTASASGCGGTLNGTTFTTGPIMANCTVTATFTPVAVTEYTLTINPNSIGYGTLYITAPVGVSGGNGIDCGNVSGHTNCTETYNANTVVSLTGYFGDGTDWGGWTASSNCVGGSVTMSGGDKTCTPTTIACNPDSYIKGVDGQSFSYPDSDKITTNPATGQASITVKNTSPRCSFPVSLVSWYVFRAWGASDYLSTQIRKSITSFTMLPDTSGTGAGYSHTFSVPYPSSGSPVNCAYQIDLVSDGAPNPPDYTDYLYAAKTGSVPRCIASCSPLSSSITAGSSVTLTASGGIGTTYQWDMDGGTTACSTQSCTRTFSTQGTYDVRVRKGSNEPWSELPTPWTNESESCRVIVTAPAFNFTVADAGDKSVVQGLSVTNTITVTKTAGTAASVALTSSGIPSGASASYSSTPCTPNLTCTPAPILTINSGTATAGTYPITVTGTSGATVRSDTFNLTITALPAPTVNLQGKQSGGSSYGEGPLSLPAGGANVDLQWIVSGNATSCTASASPAVTGWTGSKTYSPNGTYAQTSIANGATVRTYTITCANAGGSATDSVLVNITPTATLTATANPITYNTTATLNWSSTNATSCSVTAGGTSGFVIPANTPAGSDTSIALTSATTFTITCSGPGGTSAPASVTVNVGPTCSPATQPIGVEVPVTLTAGGGNGTYTWDTSNGGVGGGTACNSFGSSCVTTYITEGTPKTVTVTSNSLTAQCSVDVVGNIIVRSNIPTAWDITGPVLIHEPGQIIGPISYGDILGGYDYTISADKPGYTLVVRSAKNLVLPTHSQTISSLGGSITFNLTYTPDASSGTVNLYVNNVSVPVDVLIGVPVNLTWETTNVQNCEGTGGVPNWIGAKTDDGSEASGVIMADNTVFTLTCTNIDNGLEISDSVTVDVHYAECFDEINNDDGDAFIDFAGADGNLLTPDDNDPGCGSCQSDNPALCPTSCIGALCDPTEYDAPIPQCRDGEDNESTPDGLIDYPADPGCTTTEDNDERDLPIAQCNDTFDNDGDGLKDFDGAGGPVDPGCADPLDNSELDDPDVEER